MEGNEKFYYYLNCMLYVMFICEELVVLYFFMDESRKENIICVYGNVGYYVFRKDNCGREFDYWL